jgi:hypothetical protein
MPVNEKILGPFSEDEKEVFEAEAEKFEKELAEYKAAKAKARDSQLDAAPRV